MVSEQAYLSQIENVSGWETNKKKKKKKRKKKKKTMMNSIGTICSYCLAKYQCVCMGETSANRRNSSW